VYFIPKIEIDVTQKKSIFKKLAVFFLVIVLGCSGALFALDPHKQISQYG
jgi:hypothetical protein